MPQFFRGSVATYLGVVNNVLYVYCFVSNLRTFQAMKEFFKSVNIWRNYRHNRVARFLRHSVVAYILSCTISDIQRIIDQIVAVERK